MCPPAAAIFEQRGGSFLATQVCLFWHDLVQKTGPVLGPPGGPKTGAAWRPPIVKQKRTESAVPILGPESGPQNGAVFQPDFTKIWSRQGWSLEA